MRKIIFPAGTRETLKERVKAIVFLASLRDRKPWEDRSDNGKGIIPQIREELRAIDFPENYVRTANDITSVLRWLEDHKYGDRISDRTAKRTLRFAFRDDVLLDLHPTEFSSPAKMRNKPDLETGNDKVHFTHEAVSVPLAPNKTSTQTAATATKAVTPTVNIPIPGTPDPRHGTLQQIRLLLVEYSIEAPEEFDQWAEAAITALMARLYGG